MSIEVSVARGTSSLKQPGAEIADLETGTLTKVQTGSKKGVQVLREDRIRIRALTGYRVTIRNDGGRELDTWRDEDGFENHERLCQGQVIHLNGPGEYVIVAVAGAYEQPYGKKGRRTGDPKK